MTEQRDHIAQSMAEAAGSICFRQPGHEWEHMRSVWHGHADAALVVVGPEMKHLLTRAEKAEQAVDLLADAHRHTEQLEAERDVAHELLRDLTDPDPCYYDHHGYCQAHGWFATEPGCPHARAKQMLPAEQTEEA